MKCHFLESEQKEEGHHQTEQTHGLGQGKSKDSVGEKLLLEGGVPGVADDEGSEHRSDSSSGSSNSDGGGSSSDELGGAVNVLLGGRGVEEGGGLGGGGPHPGHGEAGRHGQASDGRHSVEIM